MIRTALILAALASPLHAAEYNFCWQGAGDYTMTGRIVFPDALMSKDVLTEQDITEFEIVGYRSEEPIGSWSLDDLTPDSTWHLRFDPQELTFPTGGNFGGNYSQGWNANGGMQDCGPNGFGFNSGNYSQDFCLAGNWVRQSAIDPETPFTATSLEVTPSCAGGGFYSKRRIN